MATTKIEEWLRVVDNKMRWHGDIDDEKKIIRVNKSPSKNKKPGEILNTIVHEEMHKIHPQMYEKNIKKETKHKIGSMRQKEKNKLYNKYAS
jgi:hypothetical protein